MRQSKNIPFLFGLFAVLSFFAFNPIIGQQKIQIKEGTADVGHFSVELLHNQPGAPMKSFSGTGGTLVVSSNSNNFILRLRNLVWFDVENEMDLGFDINMISPRTACDITFDQVGRTIYMKPIQALVTDIPFSVQGTGSVKILVPFKYLTGEGRFLQEFTISTVEPVVQKETFASTKEDGPQELTSKEIKKIWEAVDKDSFTEVAAFAVQFKDEKKAKRYVAMALDLAEELQDDAQAQMDKTKKGSTVAQKGTSSKSEERGEGAKEAALSNLGDGSDVVEDIKAVVDTLNMQFEEDVNNEILRLNMEVEGGDPKSFEVHINEMPLQVNLMRIGEREHDLINTIPVDNFIRDSSFTLNMDLIKSMKLRGEFTKYTVTNAFGTEVDSGTMAINASDTGSNKMLWILIGVSALIFGFGGFVFFNRSKKEKQRQKNKKIIADKMKENRASEAQTEGVVATQSTVKVENEVKTSGAAKQKIKIGSKRQAGSTTEIHPPQGSVQRAKNTNSRIVIRSKKKSGLPIEYAAFTDLVNGLETVHLDLSKIWSDTRIGNMYLSSQFIEELDTFLADSSNEGIQNELQGAVPEVGGFLMGRFSEKSGDLEVLVEKFVPFVPEYNDVFKIEIGTKTIVDELGDAQDKNPEQEVVGWFHTHPGHGLFLSTSDLSVQRHFPKDYQVAMEIDSLTKGLDMSFFTRKSSGKMNNSNDRKEGTGWFQWVDIENNNVS